MEKERTNTKGRKLKLMEKCKKKAIRKFTSKVYP